jgi:uncharacterized damage-inducible protein DinB
MPRDPIAALFLENIQPRPRRGGWHGGPTPVGALRGVSHELAAWSPGPGRKSIWELALHITYWKYAVRRKLEDLIGGRPARPGLRERFPRTPANFPRVPAPADAYQWKQDVALLRAEHDQLLQVVAVVPLRQYGEIVPGRRQWTVGELIVGIAQHDAYHTGQIQMLKRLWASRGAESARRRSSRPGARRRSV